MNPEMMEALQALAAARGLSVDSYLKLKQRSCS